MKKTIIALSLLAGFSAYAQDSVTLYGRVDASAQGLRYNDSLGRVKEGRVSSDNSYIGIKVRENLSGQTYAYVDLQLGVNVDDGTENNPSFRRSVVGLGSAWGNVWLGRDEAAYYRVGRTFDPFSNYSIASTSAILGQTAYSNPTTIGGGEGFNGWRSNSIGIETPSYYNTKVIATYSAREGNRTLPGIASVAAVYDNGPWGAMVAYERQNYSRTTDPRFLEGRDEGVKAGVSYALATNTKLSAVAEHLKNERDSAKYDRNAYSFGVTQGLGSGELLASYTYADKGDLRGAVTPDLTAKQLSVGYKYNLSKRTYALATASIIKNGDAANYNLPFRPVGAGVGSDIKSVGLGMVHSF